MPVQQLYFLNGTSLSDSTAIYDNSGLSILSADGWYSNGVITRQQLGGVLQPAQLCPSCAAPCEGADGGARGDGVYKMIIDTGSSPSDIGAIIIRYIPLDAPVGIKAVFDGVTYNEVSGQNTGRLGGVPTGLPIFLGNTSNQSSCPSSSIIGGPFSVPVYLWDGTTFTPTGGNEDVTVIPAQDKTTLVGPNVCVMVIPKPDPGVSVLEITSYGVCTQSEFSITVECPALLKKFKGSQAVESIEDPEIICALPVSQNYFLASVTGTYPYIGLHDLVFLDAYGINPMPDGYYRTNNLISPDDTIRVVDGVVTEILNICA